MFFVGHLQISFLRSLYKAALLMSGISGLCGFLNRGVLHDTLLQIITTIIQNANNSHTRYFFVKSSSFLSVIF